MLSDSTLVGANRHTMWSAYCVCRLCQHAVCLYGRAPRLQDRRCPQAPIGLPALTNALRPDKWRASALQEAQR